MAPARLSVNPFREFRRECGGALREALGRLYPEAPPPTVTLSPPPSPEFGELSSSVCFELAKRVGGKPSEVAEEVVREMRLSELVLLRSAEEARGYVNFYVNLAELSALTLNSVRKLDVEYGFVKTEAPKRVIVEHTSVNPIHPIHIGQARNPVLGDAIARLLRARGHTVYRHYYVDDVGRQSAIIAYGYGKLGCPEPEGKPDHFIGKIYTITSCLLEVQRLKEELEGAKTRLANEERVKLQKQLDEWMAIAVELKQKHPRLFNQLLNEILRDEDPESRVTRLLQAYEAGEEDTKRIIRKVCNYCLEGFRETLNRAGISFDSWDWESELVWTSLVGRVLDRLKRTPYVFSVGGVLEFDAEKVAREKGLKEMLGLKEDQDIPSLTLVRADGTTLYTTRDIAYSIWKLQRAERVVNVIGMEQSLPQLQIKLALCALGHVEYAKNLAHFAYNLVTLPGYKMSARRGRYIAFDNVLDEAVRKAYEEVSKRSPHLSEEEKRRISNLVGVGAVKYALIEVDPTKPVVFTWDRVVNFERNSAPYIQYSHARACSILRKAPKEVSRPDYALLKRPLEREIVLMLARFPEVFVDAAENLKPHLIADFANALADRFNSFYNALPVIGAEQPGLRDARLALVDATRIVLRNALSLIGIEAPERM